MIFCIILYSFSIAVCNSILIGTIKKARFTSIDPSTSNTLWLEQQISPIKCLCTVLSQYNNTLLFNSYSNGSCQLFFSLPYTYKMKSNMNSTIILLSQLPSVNQAPCCSNLPWLIAQIQNASISSTSVTDPSYIVLDDRDYLAITSNKNYVIRYNRTTFSTISSSALDDPAAISYYDKKYYITLNSHSSSTVAVYSTANLSNIASISISYDPRGVIFIRNGTMMVVGIQALRIISFYNIISSTSYTLASQLTVPEEPNSLQSISDTLIYMSTNVYNTPLYKIQYNSTTNSWTYEAMSATKSGLLNSNFQSTIDACDRLWVLVYSYGIRIYDLHGTKSLYNWTFGGKMTGIVLTNNFKLYVTDDGTDEVRGYQTNIPQCTS